MNDDTNHHNSPQTMRDVLYILWRAKYGIAGGILVSTVAIFIFFAVAIKHHKAGMIIAPATPMNGTESATMLGSDNMVALNYIMQRVGVGNASDFVRFENTYAGVNVARQLLKDENIRAGLVFDKKYKFSNRDQNWSPEKLSVYIQNRVRIRPVGTSLFRRLEYSHRNTNFARYFLTVLHSTTDQMIRGTIQAQTTQHISHLQDKIRSSNNPDHRRALTSLLEEQERLNMLVSIDAPYAATIIEPPAIDIRSIWPNPALMITGFTLVGALLGFAANGLVLAFMKAYREEQKLMKAQPKPSVKRTDWFKGDSLNNNEPAPKRRPLTNPEQQDSIQDQRDDQQKG